MPARYVKNWEKKLEIFLKHEQPIFGKNKNVTDHFTVTNKPPTFFFVLTEAYFFSHNAESHFLLKHWTAAAMKSRMPNIPKRPIFTS